MVKKIWSCSYTICFAGKNKNIIYSIKNNVVGQMVGQFWKILIYNEFK